MNNNFKFETEVMEKSIEKFLSEGKILEVKKVDGSLIEDVNLNLKASNLPNGKYILYRGTGWVLENDGSLIKTATANPGVTLFIEESITKIQEKTSTMGMAGDVSIPFLKVAVQHVWGRTTREEETVSTGFTLTAPADKAVYTKLYATYNRFDYIKVENNSIVASSTLYEPEGSWIKKHEYKPGDQVNQDSLVERRTRCILGEKDTDIKSSIKVQGADNAGNPFDSFKLGFDYSNNTILFFDRSLTLIHEGFGTTKYFELKILDKSEKEKLSIKLLGIDSASDKKYDKLDKYQFEIGDYIELYHQEPFRLGFNNVSGSNQSTSTTQRYEITTDGLREKGKEKKVNQINTKIENEYNSYNIMDMILNNKYESVKKINVNEGKAIEIEKRNIEKNNLKATFNDGTYVFDCFDGWIKGRDSGFLKSIIIPSGTIGELKKTERVQIMNSISKSMTSGFGYGFINSAVTIGYNVNTGEAKQLTIKNSMTANEGKDIFFKAQTVFRKYEVVTFRNGQIIDHGTTYKPESYITENIKFEPGTNVNQNKLYCKEDYNILGDPLYNYKPIVIPKIDKSASATINPAHTWPWNIEKLQYPNYTIGAYFTVTTTGDYSIKDREILLNDFLSSVGLSMRLFEVDNNNNLLYQVGYKAAAIQTYKQNNYVGFIGEPLNVTLYRDKKYVLILNEEKTNIWASYGRYNYTQHSLEFKLR